MYTTWVMYLNISRHSAKRQIARSNLERNYVKIANRGRKNQVYFKVGDTVTVKIGRQFRSRHAPKRVFGVVVAVIRNSLYRIRYYYQSIYDSHIICTIICAKENSNRYC